MNYHRRLQPGQRGIALGMVLVFLVVLTLLGTTAMRTARIEEQLAGVTYDRLVARSAADAAIADGVDFVWKDAGPTSANSNSYDPAAANDGWTVLSWRQNNTDWRNPADGGTGKAIKFGDGIGGIGTDVQLSKVYANPTFIIDRMPQLFVNDPNMEVWRVTARGVGRRALTEVHSEVLIAIRGD
jgi:type IV pilus assembly protein PilX